MGRTEKLISPLFAWDTSPKWIDREGLENRRDFKPCSGQIGKMGGGFTGKLGSSYYYTDNLTSVARKKEKREILLVKLKRFRVQNTINTKRNKACLK